jgi:hypothetical protein
MNEDNKTYSYIIVTIDDNSIYSHDGSYDNHSDAIDDIEEYIALRNGNFEMTRNGGIETRWECCETGFTIKLIRVTRNKFSFQPWK